jgi:uncharacterized repeat protein (TIGR04042 family)
MPEMHYELRWPDGECSTCYSPSLVIREWFEPGGAYPMADFLRRIRQATQIASGRVEARYGFPCSRALGQLQQIEQRAARFAAHPDAQVEMLGFDAPDV